jgi:pilus assembly protein CpaB
MLIVALIAGLVAAVAVFVAISGNDDSGGTTTGSTVPAVVATQNIAIGTEITEGMVKLTDIPNDVKVSGALTQTDLAVGEVARVGIASGEQITSAKLGVPVPEKGLSGVVPVGMRGVSFEVEEVTAVGGLLLPGDRIDILAAVRIERAPGLAEGEHILRIETVLQNVEILSVGQEAQDAAGRVSSSDSESASGTSGQLPDNVKEQPRASTITVALSPVDSAKLISAQEHAERVWAVERAYGDSAIVDYPPQDVIIVKD